MATQHSRPNILIVMTDQQKATAIRMYGNPDVPTPGLERLAAQGVQFNRCYTPHPLCVPARVSFWTSRYPHQHGSRTNEILMPTGEQHFARILHEHGYRLALFGKNHCFQDEDLSLFKDSYIFSHAGPEVTTNDNEAAVVRWIRTNNDQPRPPGPAPARINPFPAADCPTAVLARHTCRYLEQQNTQPFCAWVSIPDPHGPLQCPQPYASLHPPESLTLPPWQVDDLEQKMERVRVFRHLLGYSDMTEEQIRFRMSIYYGMIRFVDDAIAQILETLDRTGLADNTIVVFTSDHGDYAGEHRLTDKSSAMYDCLTRVPLIVRAPGLVPAGRINDDPVSLLDIMPTCLQFADIPLPQECAGQVLPDCGATIPPRDAVFSEYGAGGPRLFLDDLPRLAQYPTNLLPLLRWREAEGHLKMIYMENYKYIYDPMDSIDELYDLAADPWELVNRASDPNYASIRLQMRDRLLTWSITTEGSRPTPLYFDPQTGLNSTQPFMLRKL